MRRRSGRHLRLLGKCSVCGTGLDRTGFCWKCGGDGPPAPQEARPKPPPDPVCTPEENRAGLEMLRAAIYGKPGEVAEGTQDEVPF